MFATFRKLFGRPQATAHQTRARLGVESLDERIVPAVYTSNGHLIVTGTSGSDTVSVSEGYNKDWTVYVNGRSTSIAPVGAGLL